MAKRKHRSTTAADGPEGAEAKRSRTSASVEGASSRSVTYGRVDPTYGQRSAIPGLDDFEDWDWEGREGGDGNNGEEGDGEEEGGNRGDWEGDSGFDGGRADLEALRYLKSVREEASGIPTLLVAPRAWNEGEVEEGIDRGMYDDGVGDSRGWYEDGAYTAAPAEAEDGEYMSEDGASDDKRDAQNVYNEALLERFEALRKQLSQVPPRDAVEKLDADHGCYMSGSPKDYELWRWRVANTDPKPAQLASMDKGTILRILKVVGDQRRGHLSMQTLLGEGTEEVRTRISAWTWGLLAKLPDRGEMVSEEVGVVRDLGKRAVWVGVELKGVVDMESLKEHIEEEGEVGDEEGEIEDNEIEEHTTELDFEEVDSGFTNGEEMHTQNQRLASSSPLPKFPSSILNHNAAPFIGPISPESLRGSKVHHERLTKDGRITETINNTDTEQQQGGGEEEEALAKARANLLARLDSKTDDSPQLTTNSNPPTTASEDGEWTAEDDIPNSNPTSTTAPENQSEKAEAQQAALQVSNSHPHTHAEPARSDSNIGGEVEQTQNHHISQNRPINPTGAAKTLLDMIITIAGEVYGQRDLLEFREKW